MASGGGTKVGNAYITVTPKLADGFDSKLKEKGTPSGHEYGGKFSAAASKAMSAGAVALGNLLSNAVQSVAANIGQVFSDMFQGAMDYEQLAGGVEKIFDEADISQILADANAAYKDLNMSANEYLAAINQTGAAFAQTMGDQRGYDTARQGMLAIADYASGTGRSIDELTEKFSLITRSTSSYQSIADQFSGILPATSKDFLEQAQAAGFLSDAYTSLTEVPIDEYQQAVSQMLQKGVADMGLAGNTFMESTETMSGSLAMLKASWSNALAGILDENADLEENFNALLESISAVVENFAPRIGLLFGRLVAQLPQAIIDAIPFLIETVGQFMLGFAMGLVDGIGPTMAALEELFNQAFEAVGAFFASIGEAVTTAVSGIVSGAQSAMENAQTFVNEVFNGIKSFIGGIMSGISGIISGAVNAVKGFFNGLSVVTSVVTGIFNSVKEAITHPVETARDVVKGIIEKIKGFFNFTVPTPHIPMPHFSVSPSGWQLGDLLKGSIPSLGIEWYARGGIVDGATLIGAGESGPEMILPQRGGLMDDFSDAVASRVDNQSVVDELRRFERMIGPIIADYAPSMTQREFNRAARTAVAYG